MKFTTSNSTERVGLPDITSMIDVVFLLIIFFLTTSSLVQMTRVAVDLPEEEGEAASEEDPSGLVINIDANGKIIVDRAEVDVSRLLDMIDIEIEKSGGVESLEVLVRADQAASLAQVNDIARGMIDRGVLSWRLATRVPSAGGGN
ncbi:MAG: ExbD/TolR family protein [Phycisphaerales bacterium JB050]